MGINVEMPLRIKAFMFVGIGAAAIAGIFSTLINLHGGQLKDLVIYYLL